MSSTSSKLHKFTRAMERIYAIPPPNTPQPESWTPPPATSGHRGRYLWTDAFGVLNLLTLAHTTAPHPATTSTNTLPSQHYINLAKTLVHTVHSTLGRTRDLASPLPLSSPSHLLRGGLRIGKDDASGPDGDGQYHHYLTLWMFALNRLSLACGERKYNDLAIELAEGIHSRFVYARETERPRMYWKMDVGLEKPLVRSEGNTDPVTGLVVCTLLREGAGLFGGTGGDEVLKTEIEDYRKMVDKKWRKYSSGDPLDLGMTLWVTHFFAKTDEWAKGLLMMAKRELNELFEDGYFTRSPSRRLAFREFGTCLGMMTGATFEGEEDDVWVRRTEDLITMWEETGVVPVPDEKNRQNDLNSDDHLMPITLVMYAAALIPGAFHKDFFAAKTGTQAWNNETLMT